MSKLLVAIVHDLDVERVLEALRRDGHRVTRLRSTGGFLGAENSTLLIGIEDEAEPAVLAILERECSGRRIEVPLVLLGRMRDWQASAVEHAGATVFVVPIERIVRLAPSAE